MRLKKPQLRGFNHKSQIHKLLVSKLLVSKLLVSKLLVSKLLVSKFLNNAVTIEQKPWNRCVAIGPFVCLNNKPLLHSNAESGH